MSLPKRHQGAGKADKGMEVRYNLKGAERKKLVQAVSELMKPRRTTKARRSGHHASKGPPPIKGSLSAPTTAG